MPVMLGELPEREGPPHNVGKPSVLRDAGIRRISRLTGWLVAGSLALTAAVTGVAASAHPGRGGHAAKAAQATAPPAQSSSPGGASQPPPSDSNLQPPEQAPAPVQQAPPAAVSGGS
jgi:hypothetical protein